MYDELLAQTSTKLNQVIEVTPLNSVGPLPLPGLYTQIPHVTPRFPKQRNNANIIRVQHQRSITSTFHNLFK